MNPLVMLASAVAFAALLKWAWKSETTTDDAPIVRKNVHNNRNRNRNNEPRSGDSSTRRRKSRLATAEQLSTLETQGNEILAHVSRISQLRNDNVGDGVPSEHGSPTQGVGEAKRSLTETPDDGTKETSQEKETSAPD